MNRVVSDPNVEALCQLMAKYGLSRLQCGNVTLERPAFMSVPPDIDPKKTDQPDDEDALDRIRSMSPDAQDRALRLDPSLP